MSGISDPRMEQLEKKLQEVDHIYVYKYDYPWVTKQKRDELICVHISSLQLHAGHHGLMHIWDMESLSGPNIYVKCINDFGITWGFTKDDLKKLSYKEWIEYDDKKKLLSEQREVILRRFSETDKLYIHQWSQGSTDTDYRKQKSVITELDNTNVCNIIKDDHFMHLRGIGYYFTFYYEDYGVLWGFEESEIEPMTWEDWSEFYHRERYTV